MTIKGRGCGEQLGTAGTAEELYPSQSGSGAGELGIRVDWTRHGKVEEDVQDRRVIL